MGNDICCQQPYTQQVKEQKYFASLSSPPPEKVETNESKIPKLSDQIQFIIEKEQPFESQFNVQADNCIRQYGQDTYNGPLDQSNRPTKIGKMYKKNGAYFIGQFSEGKANGECFYVMQDGSYYKGGMINNTAEDEKGKFVSKDLEYLGGFKNNQFHGKGIQTSKNQNYSFEGTYQDGKKKGGVMKWSKKKANYVYQGQFDENGNFAGKGTLQDPYGKYNGEFKQGKKHGYGIYNFANKLKYEGYYANDKKQGQGIVINNDGTTAYKGIFKNGMPHGKGTATSATGIQFESEWVEGLDIRLL